MRLKKSTKKIKKQSSRKHRSNTARTRKALNGAYRSFRSPGLAKTDVDTYIEKITPYMKLLIEQQIKEMESAKVQLCMWVKWKKKSSKKQRISRRS